MTQRRVVETEVLVIGGGATGTGIARDLALRGVKVILAEKGDLAHGTTGRYHGLLHSGGRYAVKDAVSATECIIENRILRQIAAHCIENTDGLFVQTPWDAQDYAEPWLAACKHCGIAAQEISVAEALRLEPLLNPKITRAFVVPDAAIDSFELVAANAESAAQHDALILNYNHVVRLLQKGDTVQGAILQNVRTGREMEVRALLTVNAGGAWAGELAALAGAKITMRPAKGTMVAMNHRIVNTVVNRLHPPGDGDILVPVHTVAIIGTTSVVVPSADRYPIERWEIELLLDEGEKLISGFKRLRALRAWAGVRPLYEEKAKTGSGDMRAVTRGYKVLDHAERDSLDGFVSVVGGKLTTYRLMAEEASNLVCRKLGVDRPCRTADEPLPGSQSHHYHTLGKRLAERERAGREGQVICECELVHRDQLTAFIQETGTQNLDDVRRGLRLGMGPCQGGFCIYRASGILHDTSPLPVEVSNTALANFAQERWKGLTPILWGDLLRQVTLDDWLFNGLLCSDLLLTTGATFEAPVLETEDGGRKTDVGHVANLPLLDDGQATEGERRRTENEGDVIDVSHVDPSPVSHAADTASDEAVNIIPAPPATTADEQQVQVNGTVEDMITNSASAENTENEQRPIISIESSETGS